MTRSGRTRAAIILLAGAIVLNVILLFRAEESPGWPIAAIILLGAAAMTLFSERRQP